MSFESIRISRYETTAKLRQFLAAILATLTAFFVGNMVGWGSPVLPFLEEDPPPVGGQPITPEQFSWLSAINFLGASLGTLFWGRLSDILGRKRTACLVAFPFILSWVLMLVAPSASYLLLGRFIAGIGCSGAIINTPMYVAEIAEDRIRGTLGALLILSLNAGCLFCYAIGAVASYWELTFACLAVPFIFLVLFVWMPESPVFLHSKGRLEEAEASLTWFRGGDQLRAEEEIVRFQKPRSRRAASYKTLWATRATRRALLLGVMLVVGQQLSGMFIVITYVVKIFQDSGSLFSPHFSAVLVGALQLIASFFSFFLVDKVGRRGLLIPSFLVMGFSLTSLGAYLYFKEQVGELGWIPVATLCVHVLAYSIGAGPVPFIVMAETFAPEVRALATSVIQTLSTTLSFITVKIFQDLMVLLGQHGCFSFFGISCLVLAGLIYLFLPETKGKHLSDILKKLNGEPETYSDQEISPINK